MLQYALLHLFGYALTIDDIKAFRVSFQTALKKSRKKEETKPISPEHKKGLKLMQRR